MLPGIAIPAGLMAGGLVLAPGTLAQPISVLGTADLVLTTTWQDVPGLTINLPAGTWIVIGEFATEMASGTDYMHAKMVNATDAVDLCNCILNLTAAYRRSGRMAFLVTLGGQKTIKMQAAQNGGAHTVVYQHGAGAQLSRVSAVKVI